MHPVALPTTLGLQINGEWVAVGEADPTMTLLQFLRQTGRTGTKEGCGDGDCGACTVALGVEGPDGRLHYQAVNSCLLPLGAIAGRQVVTVEGLTPKGSRELHPVQAAMVATGGSQCGYCTPGFIMSLFVADHEGDLGDEAVEGNLCRCTGYLPIRRAMQMLASSRSSLEPSPPHPLSQDGRGGTEPPPLPSWERGPGGEGYHRPADLSGVFALMQRYPQAVLIAGGTDLGLALSHQRSLFPEGVTPVFIGLEAVAELQGIVQTDNDVTIGAAVPLTQVQTELQGVFPALDEMLSWFAARQVRNRATIGGNLGTASPIGDLSPVLLALDATVQLASAAGVRSLSIADFFQGYRQTVLQSGEVIVAIEMPKTLAPPAVRCLSQSYKVGKRGTDDISIVAAAFRIDLDAGDRICAARLAYGGVAATPMRAIKVEQDLVGQLWSWETVQRVKPLLWDAFSPLSDLRGSADYRRRLVGNLFEKFFNGCR